MVLALVVLAGTSAMAQTGLPASPVVGSVTNPKIYLSGATDSLKIVRGVAGSEISWKLYFGSDNTGTLADGTKLDLTAHPTWTNTQTGPVFRFKWTDTAAGNYYLEMTETDQRSGRTCAVTVRGYHIFIMGFDVAIYASNAAGDSLALSALSDCGGPTYPAFLNDAVMNVDGTIRTDILNTSGNPATNGFDLKPIIGTHATRATRYYTARVHFDTPTSGSFTNPAVGSVKMDIKVNLPVVNTYDSLYVHSINGVQVPGNVAHITNSNVDRNGSSGYLYTFAVEFNDSWGADLEPTASVVNVRLFESGAGGGANLGEEPQSYEDVAKSTTYRDNTSNAFTIYGKPATSEISPANP